MTVRDEVQVEVGGDAHISCARRRGRPPSGRSGCSRSSSSGSRWRVSWSAGGPRSPGGPHRPAPLRSASPWPGRSWGWWTPAPGTASGSTVSPFHLLAGIDALVAVVALTAGRKAEMVHASSGARDVATLAALVVTAISFHFLLALPDGRLHDSVRRVMALTGYAAAVAVGLVFVLDHRPFSLADGAISWSIAGLLAITPMRSRYIGSIGHHRERMEWFGIGVTLAATVRAGGHCAPPPCRLARTARCGRRGSDRVRAARPAGRGKQEDGAARQ